MAENVQTPDNRSARRGGGWGVGIVIIIIAIVAVVWGWDGRWSGNGLPDDNVNDQAVNVPPISSVNSPAAPGAGISGNMASQQNWSIDAPQ